MHLKINRSGNFFKNANWGWGTVESLVLILIIGIIAIIVINGIATTAVVVDEVDSKDQMEEIATSYLNKVYEEAQYQEFYESLIEGDVPPVPLTSEYTNAGKYSVLVETTYEDNKSKKITMTFRRPGATSFTEPIIVASLVIEDPNMF